jgi:hypothetical protein
MAGKPQILITSGNALLLAGVGALLHNVGKVNPKFIESKATDDHSGLA